MRHTERHLWERKHPASKHTIYAHNEMNHICDVIDAISGAHWMCNTKNSSDYYWDQNSQSQQRQEWIVP